MPDEWIIRVEEREYGPADLETLQEWKHEGRVLAENAARLADIGPAEEALWTTAAQIPGLFDAAGESDDRDDEMLSSSVDHEQRSASAPKRVREQAAVAREPRHSFGQILADAFRIYRKGFLQFFYLTLLVTLPWLCGQLSAFAVDAASPPAPDLRTAAAFLFTICMWLLEWAAWPVFVAGIQVLTAELAAGRKAQISTLLPEILRFWPRVAILCVFVYLIYLLLMLFGFLILVMAVAGGTSLLVSFLVLGLLALQVWLFGWFYVNVMYWQQFAVLADSAAGMALRQSRELARSGRELPWHQRPMWRGAIVASLWVAFAIVLYIGPGCWLIWKYYPTVMTTADPHALVQAWRANPPPAEFNLTVLGLGFLERLLRPLVGIAFVLLYLDSEAQQGRE